MVRYFLSAVAVIVVPDEEFGTINRSMPAMFTERANPYPATEWSGAYLSSDMVLVRAEFPDGDATVVTDAIEIKDWGSFRRMFGDEKYWPDQP